MAVDLDQYPDHAVLRTRELATWLQMPVKTIRRMGVSPLPTGTKEHRYLAGDVKRFLLDARSPITLRPRT